MDRRLRKSERVPHAADFDRAFERGQVFRVRDIVARALPNGKPCSRLGLSVGRKCGHAVRRNRIRRLLREAFRLHKDCLGAPCDVILVPRPGWRDLSLRRIEPSVVEALTQIGQAFPRCPDAD